MSTAGIGTPYWYEWEIGLIECLKMMTDVTIESVTLQSSDFQSLDDVVVKFTDKSTINIQVKHTDDNNNLTYSSLEAKDMLKKWADEWKKEKEKYTIKTIRIVTNRKWGPNARDGKCSFSDFVTKVLPKMKKEYSYISINALENEAIKWFKKTIHLPEEDAKKFTEVLEFEHAPDLPGLEDHIRQLLQEIFGTNKNEIINLAIARLRGQLEKWATSRREKQEIVREDIYRVLCDPSQIIPKYELFPEKPVFPSRIKYAKYFMHTIRNSKKKLFFLQGVPGSGKTNYISYLAQLKDTIVDFRYYTYLPVNKDSPTFSDDEGFYAGKNLWCSILFQLKDKFTELKMLSDLKFPLIFDFLSVTELRKYVLKYLPIYAQKLDRTCYLFIDGLDHVARSLDVRNSFLSQLPQPQELGEKVKFILVGQPINDKYPNWLINNELIEYCELPSLEKIDIITLLKYENIDIKNVDFNTFSSSIIRVAGNNALNVLFAIHEIKRFSSPLNYDNIIEQLEKRHLNGHINRYYDWIISSIASGLDLYKLEAIFAFSSRKIPSSELARICGKDLIELEAILNQMYPLIISDEMGYSCFHNDARLFFKELIKSNSNFSNIVNLLISNIVNSKDLDVYRYDIIFDLVLEIKDIKKLFDIYTPEYIIKSIRFQISIDRLIRQFSKVVELLGESKELVYIHKLSLVATTLSKYIECVRYYEKECFYLENQMPQYLTLSEKYILDYPDFIENIINDIYTLLKRNEFDRGKKLFNEYLSLQSLAEILHLEIYNNDFFKKCGYIYRFFSPDSFIQLNDNDKNIDFVSGWLEASSNFILLEDITRSLTFTTCHDIDLFDYIVSICKNSQLCNKSFDYLTEFLSTSDSTSIYIYSELCSQMIMRRISAYKLQMYIFEHITEIINLPDLDFKSDKILCFFKSYFCLYEYSVQIPWDEIYKKAIANHHISPTSRGYKPALALKELANKVYNIFYDKNISDEEIINIAFDLAFFIRKHGTGSSNDCGSFKVIPFLKKVFLYFFLNKPHDPRLSKLCQNIVYVFTDRNAYYIKEFAYLFFLDNNKTLFLSIVEYWCGRNGCIWEREYDEIEDVCDNVIDILHEFGEFTLIEQIKTRKMFRLLSYVGHKDYTVKGLLDCFIKLPLNESKLSKYGMNLMTISDYASKMGDNRSYYSVDEELFNIAVLLGEKYSDALFEIKNTPDEIVYWRRCLLKAYYNNLPQLSFTDTQLCDLYKLTNAWINPKIEGSIRYGVNMNETLYRYNHQLIDLIKDYTLKKQLTALGNCDSTVSETYEAEKHNINLEEIYPDIFNSIKSFGYTKEFENHVLASFSDDNHSLLNLLLQLKMIVPQKNLVSFATNCVIPYIHQNSEYGYQSYGHKLLFEDYFSYFSYDDWLILFKDFSNRFLSSKDQLYDFYSISDDLEILSLYYFIQNHPEKIELMFEDRCDMHLLFINACGTVDISYNRLSIDPNIQSISDFVKKQIGN